MLTRAWADAKRVEANKTADAIAAELVAALQRKHAAIIAALPAAERSARLTHIADELTILDYAPLGVRTGNRRAALRAELNAFA